MISGAFAYLDPDLAEHFEEAFERGPKMAPAAIGQEHIASALRSVKYLFSEWMTLGIRQWLIEQGTQTTTTGVATFNLPTGGLDVVDAVLRRGGSDIPIERMSRSEYLELADKSGTGRPDRYFVNRRYNVATVTLWRTPENSTDVIVFDYWRQIAQPGQMSNTLQMPPFVLEAFVAGLAARLAQKYKPADWVTLQTYYRGSDPSRIGGVLADALNEDRDRTDTQFRLSFNTRSRRS